MSITVTPHLNFRGQARAALDFYAGVFGGEPTVITYGQMGAPEIPEEADLVVWGQVAGENGFRVMAFDVPASRPWEAGQDPFYVSVRGTDVEELTALWKGLAEGATVRQPLGPSQWAPAYGMLTDRFGVTWVLDVAA